MAIKSIKWPTFSSFFFRTARWHNLGLLRICLSYVALIHYSGKTLSSFYNYEVIPNLHHPPFLLKWFSFPYPLPPAWMETFQYTFWIFGILAIIGLFTRPALFIFALHLVYMMGTQAARGWFDHEAAITTQVLFILALVPGSNNFSLDKLLTWAYHYFRGIKRNLLPALVGKPVPVWGVKLLLILMAVVYFTSGFSKIRFSDGKWMDGKTLTFYLDGRASVHKKQDVQRIFGPKEVPDEEAWKDGFGPTAHHYMNARKGGFNGRWGKKITELPWLIMMLSAGTLVFELLGPVILLGGWFRFGYLLGAIVMHAAIGFLMHIHFKEFQIVDFFLINWAWAFGYLAKRFSVFSVFQQKFRQQFLLSVR